MFLKELYHYIVDSLKIRHSTAISDVYSIPFKDVR